MHCPFCLVHFCWQCNAVINSANPYDHFKADGCRVFPDMLAGTETPLRLTAAQRREDRLARQQLFGELGLNRMGQVTMQLAAITKRCPFCGAQNTKDGNSNHLRCHHCRGGFCFLCLADLRRGTARHFGPAHPQHSIVPSLFELDTEL